MPLFQKYIGIDYSGAERPDSRIRGLAVAGASGDGSCHLLICPQYKSDRNLSIPDSKSHLWSRRNIYLWLRDQLLTSSERMIVGLDYGLSYPLTALDRLQLTDWDSFLSWSRRTWKTTRLTMKDSKQQVDYLNSTEKRLVEREFVPSTKSVMDLDRVSGMQGAVSYSTHTGLPWIGRLRRYQQHYGMKVHFWPYDGVNIPDDHHVIVEGYPSLYRRRMQQEDWSATMSEHERDASYIARWMQERDQADTLLAYLALPTLSADEHRMIRREGWVLGCL
ncbi:hypothetical protein [Paenibacillus shenyangensis]|uniref:hypothetical protein n=1 Tax=Paenibacillus sp. A9 TaxID=1284352 RepID=UPI00037F2999|nr:hypothetical protein [Paenibacillus sp. A9]